MREGTQKQKGVVFCQASGVRKIPQLIADVLHRCSLNAHTIRNNTKKPQPENVFATSTANTSMKGELTCGTLSRLKTSVMRPQLLSKCPVFGWHLVLASGEDGPALEQTPHCWQGGEKHVR